MTLLCSHVIICIYLHSKKCTETDVQDRPKTFHIFFNISYIMSPSFLVAKKKIQRMDKKTDMLLVSYDIQEDSILKGCIYREKEREEKKE